MQRFDLDSRFKADCVLSDKSRCGEIYYVAVNSSGGATLTPIAYYFSWRPEFVEGYHGYWRIDCFVRKHKLAPNPMHLGRLLVAALTREGLCAEPIWMSAHESNELGGEAFGEVFSDD
jgi:hypothetical protein